MIGDVIHSFAFGVAIGLVCLIAIAALTGNPVVVVVLTLIVLVLPIRSKTKR